jgi:hypothetical protein
MNRFSRARSLRKRLLPFAVVGIVAFGTGACVAQYQHPNIQNALDALSSAAQSLEHAPPEFGGHKARAMGHIRAAEDELIAALQYAG